MSADATLENESFYNSKDSFSYGDRVKSREKFRDLTRKIAYDHAYIPTTAKGLSKFLKLQSKDVEETSADLPSSGAGGGGGSLLGPEAQALKDAIKVQASKEMMKQFYNSYMAPVGSDATYRLGTVTRIKQLSTNIYNSRGERIQTAMNTCNVLGQTDQFGRLDTVSNMRTKIDIDPCILGDKVITYGYSEYYVNFFFPPFTSKSFTKEGLLAASPEVSLASLVKPAMPTKSSSGLDAQLESSDAQAKSDLSKNRNALAAGVDQPTFDPVDMMCARDGFTYRTAGFKSVNDNINFIQFLFEQCSGIVSTYLTEWDLSLYIQEGFMDYRRSPSISLCNRVIEDNPQGLESDDALSWSVLNAAISKMTIPGLGGDASNKRAWLPQTYYLSNFWWPYEYIDRGDGLPMFWDYAIAGPNDPRNSGRINSVRGRITFDDEQHMAFAGWKDNPSTMQFFSALYTTPDDGLSAVDRVYQGEEGGFSTLEEEIKAVQDALYSEDDTLGWDSKASGGSHSLVEETLCPEGHYNNIVPCQYDRMLEYYAMGNVYDSRSKKIERREYYLKNELQGITTVDSQRRETRSDAIMDGVGNVDGEGNIKIWKWEIPGSAILKMFRKRNKIKQDALAAQAKMTEKGFGNLFGLYPEANTKGGSAAEDIEDENSPNKDALRKYSNSNGISRLAPALYGGPHGAYLSPQTIEAYFDPRNVYLRNVARINPDMPTLTDNFSKGGSNISNRASFNNSIYYTGVEAQYSLPMTQDSTVCVGRSPSATLHTMKCGIFKSVPAKIMVYEKVTEPYIWGTPRCRTSTSYKYDYYYWSYGYNSSYSCIDVQQIASSFPTKRGHAPGNIYDQDTISYFTSPIRTSSTQSVYAGRVPSEYYTNPSRYRINSPYGHHITRVVVHHDYNYSSSSSSNDSYTEEYYELYVTLRREYKSGTYHRYVERLYQRPLLHNLAPFKPGVSGSYYKWQLAKYKFVPNIKLEAMVDGKWKTFTDLVDAKNNRAFQSCGMYYALQDIDSKNNYYRVTMPFAPGDNYTQNAQSVRVDWTNPIPNYVSSKPAVYETWTDRYTPEDELVSLILGNAQDMNAWSDILYCASLPSDDEGLRRTKGPRAVISIPTRVTSRTVTFHELYADRMEHPCTCHRWDRIWRSRLRTASYNWIEADLEHSKAMYASANYCKIFSPKDTSMDVLDSIPGEEYRINPHYNSPFDFLKQGGSGGKAFSFAGPGFNPQLNEHMVGWGIYSSLPGLSPDIPEQMSFEDANEFINIGEIYKKENMGNALNVPIKNLMLFTAELTNGGTRRIVDKYYAPVNRGDKTYRRRALGYPEMAEAKATAGYFGYINEGSYSFTPNSAYYALEACAEDPNHNKGSFPEYILRRWRNEFGCSERAFRDRTPRILQDVKSYRGFLNIKKKDGAAYDQGLYNFLIKMYQSCILYIPDSAAYINTLTPFATDIGACVSSALKMIEHQKGFLKYTSELMSQTVDASSIISLLETSVDPCITSISNPLSRYYSPSRDGMYRPNRKYIPGSSMYYNYWIDQAYRLFGDERYYDLRRRDDGTKIADSIPAAFQRRIDQLSSLKDDCSTFLKDKNSNFDSSENWSFNDFLACYDVFRAMRAKAGDIGDDADRYLYAYLNVLYEVRRFFINKRCNKQDGTLWASRQFESTMGLAAVNSNLVAPPIQSPLVGADIEVNQYRVDMKSVDHSISEKGLGTIGDDIMPLDKIQQLYIKIQPLTEDDFEDFIKGATKKPVIRYSKVDPHNPSGETYYAYTYLPDDGPYQLVSREYLQNDSNKKFNEKLESLRRLDKMDETECKTRQKPVNDAIQDCIFDVIWTNPDGITPNQLYLDESNKAKRADEKYRKWVEDYEQSQEDYNALEEKLKAEQVALDKEFALWKDTLGAAQSVVNAVENDKKISKYYNYSTKEYTDAYKQLEQKAISNPDDKVPTDEIDWGIVNTQLVEGITYKDYFAKVKSYVEGYKIPYDDAIANMDFYQQKYDEAETNKKTHENNMNNTLTATYAKVEKLSEQVVESKKVLQEAVNKKQEAYNIYKAATTPNKSMVDSLDERRRKYTWTKPTTGSVNIMCNLSTGLDLSKVGKMSEAGGDALEAICGASAFEDFWVISIPHDVAPDDVGYEEGLRIRTYNPELGSEALVFSSAANAKTTCAGPFAYSLCPIVTDAECTYNMIGTDVGGFGDTLKSLQ